MTTAQDRGWGPAYPDHCADARARCVTVESGGCAFVVRSEIAGLVAALTSAWHRTVEALDPEQCWSFACRAVRGSTAPSNHSWGLALDLNSAKHPLGVTGTFSAKQAQAIRALLARPEFRNFRWGGDYTGHKDEMHVEYMGTPAQALADTRLLGGEEDDMDKDTLFKWLDEWANSRATATGSTGFADSVDDDRAKINAVASALNGVSRELADIKAMLAAGGSGTVEGEYSLTVTRKPE